MSLQLIFGGSGSGKSHFLFGHIIKESMENPHKNYLVLVPEQFTMQTQKELVLRHPRGGILNIDILSFERLAHRIFQEVGANTRSLLEEIGKSFVLQKIALEKEKDLPFLGRNLKKAGYIAEMKSLISELAQYDIHPEQLDDMIQRAGDRPKLAEKLKDVKQIYLAFLDYMEDTYMTAEDVMDVLCSVVPQSGLLKDSVLAFDGFTGFTPIQMRVFGELLKTSEKVYMTITLGDREKLLSPVKEQELFAMSKSTAADICKMAAKYHVEILPEIRIRASEKSRFGENPALAFLEAHLFRFGKKEYEAEQDAIHILRAKNPLREVQLLSSKIHRLVREEGYRYGDIVVITGDLGTYGNYVRQVFADTDIPYFIDEKRNVLGNPYIEFLRGLMEVETDRYSISGVFRYLRSGMSDVPTEEVDILENYCLAMGIRGYKKWNDSWHRIHSGMSPDEILVIEEIRQKVMAELEPFHQAVRGQKVPGTHSENSAAKQGQEDPGSHSENGTAQKGKRTAPSIRDLVHALYEAGMARNIQLKLKKQEEYFASIGRADLEKEYAQIYKKVMSMFDKLVDVLGEEKVSFREFRSILEAGFMETRIGIIPPTADQVLIGDMERTRIKDVKVLMFLGVNEGLIPKAASSGGILSDTDREFLADQKHGQAIPLKPSAKETMYIQKFYLYLNLTKPSERLYLSYSASNSNGEVVGPAYLIHTIEKLYPRLRIEEESDILLEKIETPNSAMEYLIDGLRRNAQEEPDGVWKELYSWYAAHPAYAKKLFALVEATHKTSPHDSIGKVVARALYGNTLENSATRLERFAACAFAHFLQYGLRLQERKQYEFTGMDLGNIVHTVLELFAKKVTTYQYDWHTMTEEIREKLIKESMDEVIHDYGNTILHSSARNEYMIQRVYRILSRTVWALQEQIRQGDFVPNRFEVSFRMDEGLKAVNIDLEDGGKMRLKGRIDRVDTYEDDERVYVKVIDYKSGSTKFDLTCVYYGLQLQLVLYMNAAVELMNKGQKEAQPAGIFYYNVKDPMEEWIEEESDEDLQLRILKELKPEGLVQEDKELIGHLDCNLKDRTEDDKSRESLVIPVKYNKGTALSTSSSVASLKNLERLSEHVNDTIRRIGSEILSGKVSVDPYERGQNTGCDYCPYQGICGFDEKIPGYTYRKLGNIDKKEIWKKLEKEAEQHGNDLDR